MTAAPVDATAAAVGFARTLRGAGVPVGGTQLQTFVEGLAGVDARRRTEVYWVGRVTLCGHVDDLAAYDRAFAAYFEGQDPAMPRTAPRRPLQRSARLWMHQEEESAEPRRQLAASRASSAEVLRRADLARLSHDERAEAQRLIAMLTTAADRRRTRRFERARRGSVDRAATVRAMVRAQGELEDLRRRRPRTRPRRLVVLVDISGSMEPYAQALLRFAHATRHRGAPTEVFCFGTRLTRLTDELGFRDADRAMAAVAGRVADWSGGTRLGAGLGEFLDLWGQRGMARGAVVVICSDGWERESPTVLGVQMQRLSRLAHRVVWANPLKARPGFTPTAGGMAAALPYVDDFVEGHSVEALERLARVVAGATRAPRARPVSPRPHHPGRAPGGEEEHDA